MADYNLVKLWDLMDKELGRMEAPFISLRYGDFFVKAIDFEVRIEYQGLRLDVDKNTLKLRLKNKIGFKIKEPND